MRPATVSQRTTRSGTHEPRFSTVATLVGCPCFPMARAAALLGRSYLGTWLLVAVLYVGGIACYSVTYIFDEPEYTFVTFSLGGTMICVINALIAWGLNMLGAALAVPFVVLQALGRIVLVQDMYSMTGMLLVCGYAASVALVFDLARHLRKSLTQRYGPMPDQEECLPSSRCCCGVRFLATPLNIAEERQRELRDEIPAYVV